MDLIHDFVISYEGFAISYYGQIRLSIKASSTKQFLSGDFVAEGKAAQRSQEAGDWIGNGDKK